MSFRLEQELANLQNNIQKSVQAKEVHFSVYPVFNCLIGEIKAVYIKG